MNSRLQELQINRSTYGRDQKESRSGLSSRNRPNEFPRSSGWVLSPFSNTKLGFQSKCLYGSGRSEALGSSESQISVGKTNADHLLRNHLTIQHLEEREVVSNAGVCSFRQL